MRIKRSFPKGRIARSAQLLVVTVGLIAASAFALPIAVSASPQHYSASQLSDVRAAVLQSGVEGIAW